MSSAVEADRSAFLSRTIEITANLATVVVAGLLSAVLVRNYLLPTSPQPQTAARIRATDLVTVGTNLSKRVPEINWNKKGSNACSRSFYSLPLLHRKCAVLSTNG